MTATETKRARLIGSVALNTEVRHLAFEVLRRRSFEFGPGQHVCLSRSFDGETIERYYSIASAPNGTNRFELCVNAVRDPSLFGPFLSQMKPGEEVDFDGPAGTFRLKDSPRNSVFVATGTGITPIRSMLRYLLGGERDRSGGVELTLLFGARDLSWLFYRREFEDLARRHANFRFWPTLSRAADGWQGRAGYVQMHLNEAIAGRLQGTDVYLCGRQAMVREVRRRLRDTGFDAAAVVYEKYS